MFRTLFLASIAATGLIATSAADAALIRFEASLSPTNENPPVSGSSGTGSVTVDYDDFGHTLLINAQWSGLTGTTTAAHIHCCALPTANAGVAVTPGTLPSFPVGLTSGSYTSPFIDLTAASSFTAAFLTNFGGGIVANAEAALIDNMRNGRAYFNIHTLFAPGGEIRGTLVQVPEPATLSLLAFGLLGLVGSRRRVGG